MAVVVCKNMQLLKDYLQSPTFEINLGYVLRDVNARRFHMTGGESSLLETLMDDDYREASKLIFEHPAVSLTFKVSAHLRYISFFKRYHRICMI